MAGAVVAFGRGGATRLLSFTRVDPAREPTIGGSRRGVYRRSSPRSGRDGGGVGTVAGVTHPCRPARGRLAGRRLHRRRASPPSRGSRTSAHRAGSGRATTRRTSPSAVRRLRRRSAHGPGRCAGSSSPRCTPPTPATSRWPGWSRPAGPSAWSPRTSTACTRRPGRARWSRCTAPRGR